mgnify:CR=1 FL=1
MKSLEEAGQAFHAELLRRFHCERSQSSTIPRIMREVRAPVAPAPSGGDEFISQVLKYLHHDSSFAEDVPNDDYGPTETA